MPTGTRKPRSDGARSRETILRAATSLATVHGLEGLSIGNLAAHIGMSKSGLYAHFGSKQELQLATVETAREIFASEVLRSIDGVTGPVERLEALAGAFLSHLERRVFPGGCFFSSVTAELDTQPGAVRDAVLLVQRSWAALLLRLVSEAQEAGALDPEEDARGLAFEFDAYLLAGNARFVLYDDRAYLAQARRAIARRLASARVASP